MSTSSSHTDTGDVGRRIHARRTELGLDVEEVAARAGMDPTYVAYLESQPALPTYGTLACLASALETTMRALAGGGADLPSGQGAGRSDAHLEHLTEDECRQLLAPGGVGRFVFYDARGPVALPVNFKMRGDDIVFRTGEVSSLRAGTERGRVGFEVDQLDDALRQGWSVLVSGHAHEIRDDAQLRESESLGIAPWAGEARPIYIVIEPTDISGRRISIGGVETH